MNGIPDMFSSLFENPNETRRQIDEYAKTIQGVPKQKVQELINSGQMSQAQYNFISNIANMLIKNM